MVEEVGAVTPLADGLDGGCGEHGVSADDGQIFDGSGLADDGAHLDGSLNSRLLGEDRIGRLHAEDDIALGPV